MFCKDLFKLCDRCIYVFKSHWGISYSQAHLAFQHLALEDARWSVGPFPLHPRRRVNRIGTMVFQSVQLKLILPENVLGLAVPSCYCFPSLCLMVQ